AATSADPDYDEVAILDVVVTVVDDDVAGVTVVASGGSTLLTEAGATDDFTVVLTSEPTANVTVTLTPDAQSSVGSGAGVASSLLFTAANWSAPQIITMSAHNDAVAEGVHTSTVTFTVASADPAYDGM